MAKTTKREFAATRDEPLLEGPVMKIARTNVASHEPGFVFDGRKRLAAGVRVSVERRYAERLRRASPRRRSLIALVIERRVERELARVAASPESLW